MSNSNRSNVPEPRGSFDLLTPEAAVTAVESAFGFVLDGTVNPYPSYVNRVYGMRRDDGTDVVAKFYRPGRWTPDALAEEHVFMLDCAAAEIPVAAPLPDENGETVAELTISDDNTEQTFFFSVFPKMGGRNFDAETDDHWFRLGGILGRCHRVGASREAVHRAVCRPEDLTAGFVRELNDERVVHPGCREEFEQICETTIETIAPLFDDAFYQRVHGDCHRGNILDRPGDGLLIIDFDDMMVAPPVQDIWLLLPGYATDCGRELENLLEGYEQFRPFDRRTLALIEPLRFMRMVYFLAWRARQRHDYWFRIAYPDWGSEAFWIQEIEDLRTQATVIKNELPEFT